MDIYDRIRFLREQRGMSQDELAKKIGYKDRTAVSRIECGQRQVKQSMIVKLAEALQTTPAYLMGWEEEETISAEDRALLAAYHRSGDGIQEAVRVLLGLKGEQRLSASKEA